ncbi:hypothetical protein [Shewanella indica]|uniref:hypothetical protein n=1 Tax=Shewanella indica TaxID=768528 RepID=UPI0030049570
MQAVFKQTEGDYLEAVIEVAGQPLTVMDEFGGDSLTYGGGLCYRKMFPEKY